MTPESSNVRDLDRLGIVFKRLEADGPVAGRRGRPVDHDRIERQFLILDRIGDRDKQIAIHDLLHGRQLATLLCFEELLIDPVL